MIVQRPVVVCDGVMTICTIWNHAYIPEESLSFDDLIAALKEGLMNRNSPEHRSIRKTPCKVPQNVSGFCNKSTFTFSMFGAGTSTCENV